MSSTAYTRWCSASLLLAFWLAAFYIVANLLFGSSALTLDAAWIMCGLGMFALYCADAGSMMMEYERTQEDWDRIVGKTLSED